MPEIFGCIINKWSKLVTQPPEIQPEKLHPLSASSLFPKLSKAMDSSNVANKKSSSYYGPIESQEAANKLINDAASIFYALAVLQGAIEYFFVSAASGITDGLIMAGLAFLLKRYRKPWIAMTLLVLVGLGFVITMENKLNGGTGGANIYLAVIVFWTSIRAVQAIYKLKQLRETATSVVNS